MESLVSSYGPTAYDIQGDVIPLLKSKLGEEELSKRSPPENIDNYGDYRFSLGYEHQDGDCLVDKGTFCEKAYKGVLRRNCMFLH